MRSAMRCDVLQCTKGMGAVLLLYSRCAACVRRRQDTADLTALHSLLDEAATKDIRTENIQVGR